MHVFNFWRTIKYQCHAPICVVLMAAIWPSVVNGQTSADDQQQWGSLSAQFVFSGEPPDTPKVELNKDIAFCSQHHPRVERLLVNQENHGISNVVLWLYVGRGAEGPPIHPDSKASAEQPVAMDNAFCRFQPRIRTVSTGQPLMLGNKDAVSHNVNAFLRLNPPFNDVVEPSQAVEKKFSRAEPVPVKVSCSIHAWMAGWLCIQDHPYMAVSDEDGKIQLDNLPVGEWTFRAWHESCDLIQQVTHDGKAATWRRGELTITISPGENYLGKIALAPELFE